MIPLSRERYIAPRLADRLPLPESEELLRAPLGPVSPSHPQPISRKRTPSQSAPKKKSPASSSSVVMAAASLFPSSLPPRVRWLLVGSLLFIAGMYVQAILSDRWKDHLALTWQQRQTFYDPLPNLDATPKAEPSRPGEAEEAVGQDRAAGSADTSGDRPGERAPEGAGGGEEGGFGGDVQGRQRGFGGGLDEPARPGEDAAAASDSGGSAAGERGSWGAADDIESEGWGRPRESVRRKKVPGEGELVGREGAGQGEADGWSSRDHAGFRDDRMPGDEGEAARSREREWKDTEEDVPKEEAGEGIGFRGRGKQPKNVGGDGLEEEGGAARSQGDEWTQGQGKTRGAEDSWTEDAGEKQGSDRTWAEDWGKAEGAAEGGAEGEAEERGSGDNWADSEGGKHGSDERWAEDGGNKEGSQGADRGQPRSRDDPESVDDNEGLEAGESLEGGWGEAGMEGAVPSLEGGEAEASGEAEDPGDQGPGGLEWRGATWQTPIGQWLVECGGASAPVPIREALHGASCEKECSLKGVCNAELGRCRCSLGSAGQACDEVAEQSCRPLLPQPPPPPAEEAKEREEPPPAPVDLASPNGRQLAAICAAQCDGQSGFCVCGSRGAFPDRPAPAPCGLARDRSGASLWSQVDASALYGNGSGAGGGWCNLDPALRGGHGRASGAGCACRYDGRQGRLCELPTEAFCLNQCSGNGECRQGFCQCLGDWYGPDCSVPSALTLPEHLPPWISQGGGAGGRKLLGGAEEGPKDPVREVKRQRPLVYVYDLPPEFNVGLLQGRQWKEFCVPRLYDAQNRTVFNTKQRHALEIALHEALLASPHRTTNGEEADYFFVPVFGSCLMERANDSPAMDIPARLAGKRSWWVMELYQRAQRHLQEEYPFWARHQGRDHIWALGWDEGACLAPASLWPSTLLSHWGNTMQRHTHSVTAHRQDRWDEAPQDLHGGHECFQPAKDIVMPAWTPPSAELMAERYWTRSAAERERLFYFAADLGYNFANGRKQHRYSMGIRQSLAHAFASVPNLQGRLGVQHTEGMLVTNERGPGHGAEMANSKFCGVFPEDGFSTSMEEAMMHGCIPVIIQDGVQLPFENFLNYTRFSVRVEELHIPKLVEILKAIPEERIRSMQAAIQRQWQRWSYHSVVALEGRRQRMRYDHNEAWAFGTSMLREDDAMATLFQILHFKLHNDEWRKETREAGGATGTADRKDWGISKFCRTN